MFWGEIRDAVEGGKRTNTQIDYTKDVRLRTISLQCSVNFHCYSCVTSIYSGSAYFLNVQQCNTTRRMVNWKRSLSLSIMKASAGSVLVMLMSMFMVRCSYFL